MCQAVERLGPRFFVIIQNGLQLVFYGIHFPSICTKYFTDLDKKADASGIASGGEMPVIPLSQKCQVLLADRVTNAQPSDPIRYVVIASIQFHEFSLDYSIALDKASLFSRKKHVDLFLIYAQNQML